MELKVYADRMSQPSRAILIFCKANGLEFEEVPIQLAKKQHRSPEFAEINPMKQVPAIVHGDFKLFESHAILIYLASAFPGVADHWYPADARKRAKIHSVLDWHHSNLRRGSARNIALSFDLRVNYIQLLVGYIFNNTIALAFGMPMNPKAEAEGEKLLSASLSTIESLWLEDGPFLLGNSKPSIADLSLVCEIMQLEFADEKDRERILSPHKKVLKWMEDTKKASAPYFEEIHSSMTPGIAQLKALKAQVISQQSASKP